MYLLHGEDDLSRRQAVKSLLPAPDSDGWLAVSMFEGNADVSTIIEACNTLPFLAEHRYVLVRNFIAANTKRSKGAAAEADDPEPEEEAETGRRKPAMPALRDYLLSMPDTTVLILEEAGRAPASSVLYKYAKQHGEEREFRPLEGSQLTRWIQACFQERQTAVHPAAVQMLAQFVGPNLLQLQSEIDKLCAYAGSDQVTQQDVAEMVAPAEETKVWDMIDAAAIGRPDQALAQLRLLLADSANPPLRTLGAITNRFRTMVMIKELVDQRLPDMAIAKRTGLQDWSIRNTRPLLRHFSMDQLRQVYERLLETDITLKRSPLDERLTLELLVLDVATRNLEARERGAAEAAAS